MPVLRRDLILSLGLFLSGSMSAVLGADQGPPVRRKVRRIEDFAPESGFVQVDHLKTHFIREGECGPPVVLVHGFGDSTHGWDRNIGELARACRVYALDLRGFGLTDKPKDGRYNMAELTRHLLGFLDAMGLEAPTVVGHSMGAAVATRLALTHPDRVSGLILVAPAPLEFPRGVGLPVGGPDGIPRPLLRALTGRASIEIFLKRAFHNPENLPKGRVDVLHRVITIDGAEEALIAFLNPPPEPPNAIPRLAALKLRSPVLIMKAAHDRIISSDQVERYVAEIPGAQTLLFEQSGHQLHEEEADKFNEAVIGYARVCRPGR